ncbi:uncharacterized protein [Macrobrachium rosenbergii]|uniref:uncharacterized protein n=1 Tax=Macrobrachium rosenbergii TaxID=79674 RepID=UPI0034D49CDA
MDRRENWVYKDPELQGQAKSVGRLNSRMVTVSILVTFLLTVGNFAHCQDLENYFVVKMEELLENQEAALNQLKKQEAALKDMQEKQGHIEDKLQEMQEKLGHVENNLQDNQ